MSARPLAPAEARLARTIFGDALNLDGVRIHDRPYLPWQAKGVAMAPNGHIYFHASDCREDFTCDVNHAAWLVHELTHVWQRQAGRSVRMRGLIEQLSRAFGRDPYHYGRLESSRPFASYGLEQQAAMVEDMFRVSRGLAPRHGSGSPDAYWGMLPFRP